MDNRKQRELKFRAWDGVDYMSSPFSLLDIVSRKVGFTNDAHIMQYTGKHDANDSEIYEADIIDDMVGNRYSVEWNDDLLRWQLSDGSPLNDGDNYGKLFIVIGNLYETPDLLTPQPNP